MTEAADLDAARMDFMNCATEVTKGKDVKDEQLEIRKGLQYLALITVPRMCTSV